MKMERVWMVIDHSEVLAQKPTAVLLEVIVFEVKVYLECQAWKRCCQNRNIDIGNVGNKLSMKTAL